MTLKTISDTIGNVTVVTGTINGIDQVITGRDVSQLFRVIDDNLRMLTQSEAYCLLYEIQANLVAEVLNFQSIPTTTFFKEDSTLFYGITYNDITIGNVWSSGGNI